MFFGGRCSLTAVDIDNIVRQVRFTGWTRAQNGNRTVLRGIRLVLEKIPVAVNRRTLRPRVRLYSRELLKESEIGPSASYGGTSEIMKTIIARDLTGLRA